VSTPLPDAAATLEVSPASVSAWHRLPRDERPRLIDCREADELAICRITGAEWFPLGNFPEEIGKLTADSGRGVVVFCHHGMRSMRAAMFLRANGVENAFSMRGGTDLWAVEIDSEMTRY
jgi:rhodanese-related sulfurtransferase